MPMIDFIPNSAKRLYVRLAEKAMGHALPPGALVHHVDEDRSHNVNANLVILQDQGEHLRLHRRLRIVQVGGNPWTQQICCTCQQVKDLSAFPPSKRARGHNCLECSAKLNIARHNAKMGRAPRKMTSTERSELARSLANRRWGKTMEVGYATH